MIVMDPLPRRRCSVIEDSASVSTRRSRSAPAQPTPDRFPHASSVWRAVADRSLRRQHPRQSPCRFLDVAVLRKVRAQFSRNNIRPNFLDLAMTSRK